MSGDRASTILVGAVVLTVIGVGMVTMGPRLWTVLRRWVADRYMPVYDGPVESSGDYTNIIFLHHSVGRALIAEGNVRPMLAELGYQFWDHGYNFEGLVKPDGKKLWANYGIPGNGGAGNTDVEGLAKLFSQPVTDPPENAFSRLLQHEVIVTKSCFPNSAVESDEMQRQFQTWYLQMRDEMDRHSDHVFIVVTSPPLHPLATNPDQARRARAIAEWLKSESYAGGHPNVFVFDLFGLLADPTTNTLRAEYQLSPDKSDSHPNQLANETIGPLFVRFIDEAIQTYRGTT